MGENLALCEALPASLEGFGRKREKIIRQGSLNDFLHACHELADVGQQKSAATHASNQRLVTTSGRASTTAFSRFSGLM